MARVGLTTQRVVSVAADLVDRDGPAALTLAGLAARLEVRAPSLYSHVGGIDELRRLIGLQALDLFAEAGREAAIGRSGADALRHIARAYRETARAHPGMYAFIQAARPGDHEWGKRSERVLAPLFAALGGMGLEGDRMIHAARTVRSALHGFVILENGDGFGLAQQVDVTFTEMIETLINGLQ